jgi:hypothetical protein
VERANYEILRHLKAILYHTKVKSHWHECLPFVQRIINANVNSSIGVSPAQLLFGNAIMLDNNIVDEAEFKSLKDRPQTMSEWAANLLKRQRDIIEVAIATQIDSQNAHLTKHQQYPITSFPINSFVLAQYPEARMGMRHPTKLHMPWKGPLKVLSNVGNRYELFDPATGKIDTYHVSRLKKFEYDPKDTNPTDIAMKDNNVFLVDAVLDHDGTINNRKKLKFKIRWLGYDEQTWEPWDNLRDNSVVHSYLAKMGMMSLIPARYRSQHVKVASETSTQTKRRRKRKHY